MKTLILVRHAKSSWADRSLRDHDRPLNDRGRRDAPRMARRLAERGPVPQAIVSSSATRALATAHTFASELGLGPEALTAQPAIYGASVNEMISVIHELDDAIDPIMLVGHNPTFSRLASLLSDRDSGDLPTCAVVTLRWDEEGAAWRDADEGSFELVDFDYPKRDRRE